ncbi:hypothetical protein Anas_13702 [Armadillidium nasatum]|uniref:PiggyBac transposable element-derived protein domain-containing protein n=1 Tax=Armadillidium nasatum TaxID=96803 RepID=A0A5N5TB58_9CRUS|nr:hypothetical protein Anas_13702 [Armadillidium nasatum]
MFLGINLWMGLNGRGSIDEYWSKSPLFESPLTEKLMSRNQFQLLLNLVNFADNNSIEKGNQIVMQNKHDRKNLFFSTCHYLMLSLSALCKLVSSNNYSIAVLLSCKALKTSHLFVILRLRSLLIEENFIFNELINICIVIKSKNLKNKNLQ